jgi:hypothetical protein
MKEVVLEVLFNDISFVTAADYKLVDIMSRVHLHDMPENWLATDFDHRLGLQMRFFGDSSAKPSRKDYCFHPFPTSSPLKKIDSSTPVIRQRKLIVATKSEQGCRCPRA